MPQAIEFLQQSRISTDFGTNLYFICQQNPSDYCPTQTLDNLRQKAQAMVKHFNDNRSRFATQLTVVSTHPNGFMLASKTPDCCKFYGDFDFLVSETRAFYHEAVQYLSDSVLVDIKDEQPSLHGKIASHVAERLNRYDCHFLTDLAPAFKAKLDSMNERLVSLVNENIENGDDQETAIADAYKYEGLSYQDIETIISTASQNDIAVLDNACGYIAGALQLGKVNRDGTVSPLTTNEVTGLNKVA